MTVGLTNGSFSGAQAPSGSGLKARTAASPAEQMRLDQTHLLQNTFTAVLNHFGREGFASADAQTETATPLESRIQASWNEWFEHCGRSAALQRFAEHRRGSESMAAQADKLQENYAAILTDAFQKGGYLNPREFVRSLGREQLETLQMVQGLADPIDPQNLQEEGALNLLIPPAAQVDADRDGLTQVGIGLTIRFPDSTTPRDVRDAWEDVTAGMEPGRKAIYELQMKHSVLFANMIPSEDGSVTTLTPGDPKWRNPMSSADFSYTDLASQFLEYLDYFRAQIPPEQFQRDHSFWSDFRDRLEKGEKPGVGTA